MTKKNAHNEIFFNIRYDFLICLFLVIATLAVYWQVKNYGFVEFDDYAYVAENHHVQAGLTLEGIIWAFTATDAANWHPLTWVSHMLDVQLYGMNPGRHHMTNLLFHIVNTLLLFLVFRRMTGLLWQSGFVAALFALHPLHVESVAWVAERKDVLCAFFWMLTMCSYVRYVERPEANRYFLALLFFTMGLMAKPMIVTLPFALLLLDYWPLKRFRFGRSDSSGSGQERLFALRLILEKAPLFLLAAASSIVTFLVQQSGGAVAAIDVLPIDVRIGNALVSYAGYLGKMFWPFGLAVLYPHPGKLPLWQIAGACLLLISISLLAISAAKKRPWFVIGWLWYIGTFVPVIGLVQVGTQAMADRYTYVPLIGISIVIAWGVAEFFPRWYRKKMLLAAMAAVVLSILMTVTWLQTRYWTNSITLFKHAVDVTAKNHVAHYNLGVALAKQGKMPEAVKHYSKALAIRPDFEEAHNNLGFALAKQDRIPKAVKHYSEALRFNPGYTEAHNNLGNALVAQGKLDEAIVCYSQALQIDSNYAEAHNNLGLALVRKGKMVEAIAQFQEALRIKPDYTSADNNLQRTLRIHHKIEKAVIKMQEALKINPEDTQLRSRLENLYKRKGELDEAIDQYQKALSTQPGFTLEALRVNNLAIVYAVKKEYDQVVPLLGKIAKLQPDSTDAYYYIACIYARQNKIENSIEWLKKAVKSGYDNWSFLKKDDNLENIRGSLYYKELMKCR